MIQTFPAEPLSCPRYGGTNIRSRGDRWSCEDCHKKDKLRENKIKIYEAYKEVRKEESIDTIKSDTELKPERTNEWLSWSDYPFCILIMNS